MSFFRKKKNYILLDENEVIDEAKRAEVQNLEKNPKAESHLNKAKIIALKWRSIGIKTKLSSNAWKEIVYGLPNDKSSDVTRKDISESYMKVKKEIEQADKIEGNFNLMTK